MNTIETFRNSYAQLRLQRPSVIGSGFWFTLVFIFARLLFALLFAGFIACSLWAFQIIEFGDAYKELNDLPGLKPFLAAVCLTGMLASGFAARMSKRIIARNVYILQLESLLEETVLKEENKQIPPTA